MAELYSKLAVNQIRLLRVFVVENEIFCRLRVVDLSEQPDYVCLSYTWGPTTDDEQAKYKTLAATREIVCNGHRIQVTHNLHAFLLRALEKSSGRDVWIDAICINQLDDLERTQQVNLMSLLYSSAQKVLVWLGEEDAGTEKAFKLLKVMANLSDVSLKRLGSDEMINILGHYGGETYWRAVADIFGRTYFRRVWIVQEVALARAVTVHCGSHTIDWDDVVLVSKALGRVAWTRWIAPPHVVTRENCYHGTPYMLQLAKQSIQRRDPGAMLSSLTRSRLFFATDPRDKIYALLGIAGDSVKDKPRYAPIYGDRSVAETYILAAIQILEDSDHLLLLGAAEGEKFRNIASLPSWVPDWSCTRYTGLGIQGYTRFQAAGDLSRVLEITDNKILTLSGKKFDDIAITGTTKFDIINGASLLAWQDIISALPRTYHTGQARAEVFWRTMITDTGGRPVRHPIEPRFASAYQSWVYTKLGSSKSLFTEDLEISDGKLGTEEYELPFNLTPNLQPFVTSRRYLGMGSESLRKGDSVWIVRGSRIPLILREVRVGAYELVGGAYVHGFMHGEALLEDATFQAITLV